MKKGDILCAVDFSESSIYALKWAIDLAKRNNERLTIMLCYRLIAEFDGGDTLELKRNIEYDARAKFRDFEEAYLRGQPINYRFIIEVGFYHFRIEKFLLRNPVGLVVMGDSIVQNFDEHKTLAFEHFVQGSKVPVIVIPQGSEVSLPM